jgi:aspartyl-tRNA(Asn)/glutamyl-tRNA(Gln) amidotransferase subunit C
MLAEVNTDDVPPTTHPLSLQNIFREDIREPSFTLTDVVANAPKVEGGFFKVKPVL